MKLPGRKGKLGDIGGGDPAALIAAHIGKKSSVLWLTMADLDGGRLKARPPSAPAHYDAVVCEGVIEQLDDAVPLLAELKSLLRSGGRLIISVPNVACAGIILGLIEDRWEPGNKGPLGGAQRRYYTRKSLVELLETAGLRPGWIETVQQPLDPDSAGPDLARTALVNYLKERPDAETSHFVIVAEAGAGDAGHTVAAGAEALHLGSSARPEGERLSSRVDVVIPADSGLEQLRRCLESVLAGRPGTPFETIAVDYGALSADALEYLRRLSADGRITLLEAGAGTGFADAANLGMLLHTDRDVVLLESDTEVGGDWLDRLRLCAGSAPNVGIATPFSNNALYLSYPRTMHGNGLPAGESAASQDGYFAGLNRGAYPELPSAVGFCNYITRRCLDEAGFLDSLHFGFGYEHIHDLSLRAMLKGFSRLLCGDLFVRHGGDFFQPADRTAAGEAGRLMARRHPGFKEMVSSHRLADPELPLRRRIDLARLTGAHRAKILFVCHTRGGMAEKHMQQLARLLEADHDVLILRPDLTGEAVTVEWALPGEELRARFPLPDGYADLLEFLGGLGIVRLHFHHTHGLAELPLSLAQDLGLPYDFSVYDYYAICPRSDMVNSQGVYCGEPETKDCHACLAGDVCFEGEMGARRALYRQLLHGAARVLVPAQDAIERLQKYFPQARYTLLPLPEEAGGEEAGDAEAAAADTRESSTGTSARAPGIGTPPGAEVKVLALGEVSLVAGAALLEACAADARRRGLPLNFRALGRPRDEVSQEPELPLKFLGAYREADLARLVALERADVIFFPAPGPQVHSCSLPAALLTGLPIAAPELGVFPEQLAGNARARLLDCRSSAAEWNDLFLSLREAVSR